MADTRLPSRPAFTVAVWLTIAMLAGEVGLTAVTGLVDRMVQGWAAAVFAAGMAVWWLGRSPRVAAATAAATAASRRWFVVGAAALLGQLLLLTTFIIDPNIAVWPDTVWHP